MVDQAQGLRDLMRKKEIDEQKTRHDMHEELNQKIISISSGKGGVGKTNISINLGIAMAKQGKKVLIMDADFGLSNVNIILGKIPEYNLFHVFKGTKKLQDIIFKTEYGIDIIAGASGFNELTNMKPFERDNFISQLDELNIYDIIILDIGAGISENVIKFALIGDELIIITTPEPTAITDAYGIIKILLSENKDINVRVIVNKIKDIKEGRQISMRMQSIVSQFLNYQIDILGYVYLDEELPKAVMKQKPFYYLNGNCKAGICIDNLSKKILNLPYNPNYLKVGLKNFIKNIFN